MAEPTAPYPLGLCTIYPPGAKNSWRIRWQEPSGQRRERTSKTRAQAEQVAAEINASVANASPAGDMTVENLAQTYLASMPEGTYHENQEGLCRLWIVPVIGHLHLDEWRPLHSKMVLQGMTDAGLGDERIASARRAMRALISFAQDQGWYGPGDDPLFRVRHKVRATIQGESADFVPRETLPVRGDIDNLVKAAPDDVWALAWGLTSFSGVRWGELIALTGADVDFAHRGLLVSKAVTQLKNARRYLKLTKNNKVRTTIFPPSLEEPLRQRVEEVRGGLLFPGLDGEFAERTWHRRKWIRAAQGAGWEFAKPEGQWPTPPWSIHDFRHFAACWMLFDLKADVPDVSNWLGHHSPAFTYQRYVGSRGNLMQTGLELTEGW